MSTPTVSGSPPQLPAGRRPRRRLVAPLIAVVAVAGVVVGVVVVQQRDDGDAATSTAAVSLTKLVTVERGDLDVSETVDGSIEETDTVSVIHRIEGQQSVGVSTGSSSGSTPQAATGPAASGVADTSSAPATAGLTSSPLSLSSATESFTLSLAPATPVDPSVPATTVPATPTPDTSTPGTPTPGTPTPDTSVPDTSTPVPTPTPTPTTVAVPGGSLPVGGAPPSGVARPAAGGTPTGAGATGTTGSTATVTQVITGVADVGDEIASGDVLYTVESSPVVALTGALPAWRTMDRNSADGLDIAQLEAALVALGYDPDGDVVVDQEWDSATTAMVRRWQSGLHLDDTGEVTLGSVVFIAHTGTVTGTSVSVGDEVQDGSSILSMSGTVQQVIIEVPEELQANVTPSSVVDIAGTPGTVQRLRSAEGTDGVTVQALIIPDSPLSGAAGSVVKVTLSYAVATDQLVVATEAIVSRLDGGYAVEVVDADGARSFVPVDVVAVSGNRTAISGDGVTESMTVLAPA